MTPFDRRGLLRLAAVGAAGSLTAACSGTEPKSAGVSVDTPATTSARPATAAPHPLPFEVRSGPRTGNGVALTFHGQGDPGHRQRAARPRPNGPAPGSPCWPSASWLDAYPQLARRILDGGHELGNHTQTHGDIGAMGAAAAHRRDRRLRRAGCSGSPGRAGTLVPPLAGPAAPPRWWSALARRAGYPHLLSLRRGLRSTTPTRAPAAVARNVLAEVRAGSVVSLHFGHAGTVAALPAILDDLHRRGLRAVTTSELLS